MKRIILLLSLLLVFWACSSDDEGDTKKVPIGSEWAISENGRLQYMGGLRLNEGLSEMKILENDLYGIQDENIYRINIASPEKIRVTKQKSFSGRLSGLVIDENRLFTLNKDFGKLYEMDRDFNVIKEYALNNSEGFIPTSLLLDGETVWIGGSKDSKGTIGKFTKNEGSLVLEEIWDSYFYLGDLVSLVQKGDYILACAANGVLFFFEKDNIQNLHPGNFVFGAPPDNEAWRKTLMIRGNKLHWANYEAGFLTLDITDVEYTPIDSYIMNSEFKEQFPNSEEMRASDLVYNSTHHLLCIANGKAGIFIVDPNNAGEIIDYLDIDEVQNYSIATKGNYIYTGNISGGISGKEKGVEIYKIK